MPIDWMMGLIGGLMIGLGGAIYLLINGRIMGASGILGGLVDGSGKANGRERLAFVAGVFVVPTVIFLLTGPIDTHVTTNITVLIAAGLLVGV